jgi:hypothetical protein
LPLPRRKQETKPVAQRVIRPNGISIRKKSMVFMPSMDENYQEAEVRRLAAMSLFPDFVNDITNTRPGTRSVTSL